MDRPTDETRAAGQDERKAEVGASPAAGHERRRSWHDWFGPRPFLMA